MTLVNPASQNVEARTEFVALFTEDAFYEDVPFNLQVTGSAELRVFARDFNPHGFSHRVDAPGAKYGRIAQNYYITRRFFHTPHAALADGTGNGAAPAKAKPAPVKGTPPKTPPSGSNAESTSQPSAVPKA